MNDVIVADSDDRHPYDEFYEFDIFVSYAQGPPLRDDTWGPLRTWSNQFQEHLSASIEYILKAPPRVFFDAKDRPGGVDGLAPLDRQIKRSIERSAILQIHMEPWYLASKWCERERRYWHDAAPPKPGSPEDRISVVRLTETNEAEWPEDLMPGGFSLPGVRCHGIDKAHPWGWLEDWGKTVPTDLVEPMIDQASLIADRIKVLRDELQRKKQEKLQVISLLGKGAPPKVFVHAPKLTKSERLRFIKALAKHGILAVFQPAANSVKSLDEIVTRCSAILIVASDFDQLQIDIEEIGHRWHGGVQSDLKKVLPRAIVDCSGIDSALLRVVAKGRRIDWIENGKDWAEHVREWLSGPAAAYVAQRYGIARDALDG